MISPILHRTNTFTHHHHFLLLLLSFLFAAAAAAACNSTCGSHRLPFPFGFSAGCPIPLICTPTNAVLFAAAGFPVHAVTSDSLLISLKPNCSRPLDSLRPFFSVNFAPTKRNAFLLRNCAHPFSACKIPTTLVRTRFDLQDCGGRTSGDNLSCYSEREAGDFIDLDRLMRSSCEYLFSSILAEADSPAGMETNETALEVGETVVDLEIEVAELRWWLVGQCGTNDTCSTSAACKNVESPGNGEGFRCRCSDGYVGDGYKDGLGCRKVAPSACDPSKYVNGKCGGLTKVNVLVAGVVAGASLALISISSVCVCFRRKHHMTKFRKVAMHRLSESGTICIPIYPYKHIQKATNNFAEDHRLGTGAYGTVYKAKLHNDEVAIKRIKHRETGESVEQVINEIKLLSSVDHPSLVRLLGCSVENLEEQILVYEFMPNGTLCQHLQREIGNGLSWRIRLSIAKETAQAIAYLHSAVNPPIYHRDIKSSNILLDHNFKAKVADFGLSRFGLAESSYISTAPQGTPGYVDPQYHQNFHLSDKSDVYSFGVVLAEMITGMKVVDFSRSSEEVNLAALAAERIGRGCVDEIIDPLMREEVVGNPWTASSVHKVAELAFRCLAYHRDMRPSMVEVASELERIEQTCEAEIGSSESELGLTVKKARFGSLGFYMLETEASGESSQELWSSQQSSPSSSSLLPSRTLHQ